MKSAIAEIIANLQRDKAELAAFRTTIAWSGNQKLLEAEVERTARRLNEVTAALDKCIENMRAVDAELEERK